MTARFSLRTRFLLLFISLLLGAFFLTSQHYYRSIRDDIVRGTQEQVVRELGFIHQMLTQEMNFKDTLELGNWLELIGKGLKFRITYIADGGTVIADSHVPHNEIPNLENHASRPEVMEARAKDMGVAIRFSGSTLEKQLYVARTIEGRGAIPSGILRVSTPFSEAKELQSEIKTALLVILLVLVTVTVLASLVFFLQLKKPVREVVAAMQTIGLGDYKQRVILDTPHEFQPLERAINEMARRFDEHVREISEQQQQLQAIFDGMQEGVMVLTPSGRIKSVNRALSEVISNPSQAIGRRPLEAIMNLELQDACDRILTSAAHLGRRPLSLQIELEPEKFYEVNVVRMHEKDKNLGAILVFHNISELKRLEKVRQDFVANVTHELRTPLTSIKGYTETLLAESKQDDETVRSFLQVILKNTNHMVKMVDDLLQLARIESKRNVSRAVPVNAGEALEMAWKECTALAQSKNIQLQNFLPFNGVHVLADLEQLTQVFRNLLENAIKYGPDGSQVTVFCKDEGRLFTLGVQDQGPGIPPEHQQRVFERFYRIERHRSPRSGSTGLGLAICKHIVQGYGGKIWLQSPNPDGSTGCTFSFSLPKAPFSSGLTSGGDPAEEAASEK